MQLWPFQQDAVAAIEREIRQGKKSLLVSPGGSGKTVMISEVAARRMVDGRVLIVSHRKEIIEQTVGTLIQRGHVISEVGILRGDTKLYLHAPIVVASIMTLRRHHWQVRDVRTVLVDEAHHVMAGSYERTLGRYNGAVHVGFTATPFRLDGKGLGDVYDSMVTAALPSELIKQRRLARPIVYRAPRDLMPDLRGLRIARGDYILGDLAERVSSKPLIGGLVHNYSRRAGGKRAIAFAVNVEHSLSISAEFNASGIPAAHIDGTMGELERETILANFRAGRILVLSNCYLLSEGYDLPDCDAVILARPTKSLVLFIQQCARAMRYRDQKRPAILDHAQLMDEFGLPEADREFRLTNSKLAPAVRNTGPVKDCPSCEAVIPAGCGECENCGHRFPKFERPIPVVIPALLKKYSAADKAELERKLRGNFPDDWVDQVLNIWAGHRDLRTD